MAYQPISESQITVEYPLNGPFVKNGVTIDLTTDSLPPGPWVAHATILIGKKYEYGLALNKEHFDRTIIVLDPGDRLILGEILEFSDKYALTVDRYFQGPLIRYRRDGSILSAGELKIRHLDSIQPSSTLFKSNVVSSLTARVKSEEFIRIDLAPQASKHLSDVEDYIIESINFIKNNPTSERDSIEQMIRGVADIAAHAGHFIGMMEDDAVKGPLFAKGKKSVVDQAKAVADAASKNTRTDVRRRALEIWTVSPNMSKYQVAINIAYEFNFEQDSKEFTNLYAAIKRWTKGHKNALTLDRPL